MSSAVVLLSGGLDSAVAAALCGADGFALHALTVDYGQRHCREIEAAVSIARHLDCREHLIQRLDLTAWGGSSLTDDIPVPAAGVQSGIPVTYVPARNTVLLALATAFAEARGADRIVI
ncbi:MAG TPA: 7-cyano-7-deazaguanine synthase, partial [Candidatus Binatia bacterium]|nr:7-cyano-7-deazaguanine synthase [Candidatus Binatia bacterium]